MPSPAEIAQQMGREQKEKAKQDEVKRSPYDTGTQSLLADQEAGSTRDPNLITQDALRGVDEGARGLIDTKEIKTKADALGGYNPDSLYEALNRRSQDNFTDQMTAMKAKQNVDSMGKRFEQKAMVQNNKQHGQMLKMQEWQRKKQLESAKKQARAAAIGGIFRLAGTAAGTAFGGPVGGTAGGEAGAMVGNQVASST